MIAEAVLERVRYRTLYPAADAFIRHNGSVTESQMAGLRELFASGQDVGLIQSYIKKRIIRSQEGGRPDYQQFWLELDKKLTEYQKQAASLLRMDPPDSADVRRLLETFIVCLCAENRYRQKVADESARQEPQRGQEGSDARRTDKPSSVQRGPRSGYGASPGGRGSGPGGPKR